MGSERKKKFSKDFVENIVKDCRNVADFCRKVGWVPRGDNYKVFRRYVDEYGLDISHFTGCKTNLGGKLTRNRITKSDEYLTEDSFKITTNKLLKKILDEGKKACECECCHNSEWNGKQIPLELHHINGVNSDNRIENLMVLCPNCHAQTDNYRGKNIRTRKEVYFCKNCGKELYGNVKTGLCIECYRDYERSLSKCPSKDKLEELHKEYSMSRIGLMYSVSGRTVKKWMLKYKIIND